MPKRLLVIGLGSTGAEVCNRMIERIEWEYGGLSATPWVRFLAIETAPLEGQAVLRTREVPSFPNGRVTMDVRSDTLEDILRNPARYREVMEPDKWLDVRIRDKVDHIPGGGAGHIRMLGRLAFLEPGNLGAIRAGIAARLRDLGDLSAEEARAAFQAASEDSAENWECPDDIYIYVVGSLCGGTASGCFIDLGYVLSKLPTAANKHTTAILALYPEQGDNDHLAANCYTGLVELNHFQSEGTTYRALFPGEGRIESVSEPYENTFLLSPRNDRRLPELVQSIAQWLYGEALLPDFKAVDAEIANMATARTATDRFGCTQNYLTFGVSTLEYPAEQVIEGCVCRLLTKAMEKWRGDRDVHRSEAEALLRNRLDLSIDGLRGKLMKEGNVTSTLDGLIAQIRNATYRPTDVIHRVEDNLDYAFDVDGGQPYEGDAGFEQDAIRAAVDGAAPAAESQARDELRDALREELLDLNRGPVSCRGMLRELQGVLDDWLKELEATDDEGRTQDEIDFEIAGQAKTAAYHQVRNAENDGVLPWVFLRGTAIRRAVDEYAYALGRFVSFQVRSATRAKIARILRALQQDVGEFQRVLAEGGQVDQYLNTVYDDLRDRRDLLDRETPRINGKALFQSGETLSVAYFEALRERAGSNAEAALEKAEEELCALALRKWERLSNAVFPASGHESVGGGYWKKMDAQDREQLYRNVRTHFDQVHRISVLDRWFDREDREELATECVTDANYFLQANWNDATRRTAHPASRAAFVFYRGQSQADRDGAPQEWRAFHHSLDRVHRGDAELRQHDSDEKHRVTFVRVQAGFSLAIVDGLSDTNRFYHERYQRIGHALPTFYSRADIVEAGSQHSAETDVWEPIEGRPKHELRLPRQWTLLGLVIDKIDRANLGYRYEPQGPTDSGFVQIPGELTHLGRTFRAHPTLAHLLENDVRDFRQAHGDRELVERICSLVQGAATLKLRTREEPLSSRDALDIMMPFLVHDESLKGVYDEMFPNTSASVPPEDLHREAGQVLAGGGGSFPFTGYYCDRCELFLGDNADELPAECSRSSCSRVFNPTDAASV